MIINEYRANCVTFYLIVLLLTHYCSFNINNRRILINYKLTNSQICLDINVNNYVYFYIIFYHSLFNTYFYSYFI